MIFKNIAVECFDFYLQVFRRNKENAKHKILDVYERTD